MYLVDNRESLKIFEQESEMSQCALNQLPREQHGSW